MGIKVSDEVKRLKKTFGERFIEYIDGSCVLKGSYCFYIYGVLGDKLIMKEIPSTFDLRFRNSIFCVLPIESALKESYDDIEYAERIESTFMSRFGYSFKLIRYDKFCRIVLGENNYFLPADTNFTIEDFIKYIPDLVFRKGLHVKYLDLYCINADLENGEADFCILNTKNKKYVSERFTLSELNHISLIDLAHRHEELYPVGSSKRVKVVNVSKNGMVDYEIDRYGKIRTESMPLELFITATSGMLVGVNYGGSNSIYDGFYSEYTKDIENSIREYRENVKGSWGY